MNPLHLHVLFQVFRPIYRHTYVHLKYGMDFMAVINPS